MNKDIAAKTAKILLDTNSVMINTENPFTYTSGKVGPTYVDIRRMISFPAERKILMDYAADIVRPFNADFLAGGETAGIPYAAYISERLDLPMLYIRKKPKGHGRMAQIEGCMDETGATVVLVEDLLTVGTSQKIFVDALREAGAKIKDSFVLFSYDIYPTKEKAMADMGISCHALTNWWAILDVIKSDNLFDTDTIGSLEAFLNAPEEWKAA